MIDKWLARWARSIAEKSWMGLAFGSAERVSSFSRFSALSALKWCGVPHWENQPKYTSELIGRALVEHESREMPL